MPDQTEGLTVLFPVTQPITTLVKSLDPWLDVLNRLNRPFEVFLISDGPNDELTSQAAPITSANPRVKLLVTEKKLGYGACIRLGIAESTQPLVFYSALNEGWNPADLPRLLQSIDFRDEYTGNLVQIVNGHRRGVPEPSGRKWRRKFLGLFIRVVYGMWPDHGKGYLGPAETRYWYRARLQFGLRLGDVNSRFKLFRKSVVEKIVFQSDGEFIHTELLAKANFLGTMMDEIPLADQVVPGAVPEMTEDRQRVFKNPKFRSPVPTPGFSKDLPTPDAVSATS